MFDTISLYFTFQNLLGAADIRHSDPIKSCKERCLKAEATGGNLAVIFLFWPLIGRGVR